MAKTKKTTASDDHTCARLTIQAPGCMTDAGRKAVSSWLRVLATDLNKRGNKYTEGKFIAKFICKE